MAVGWTKPQRIRVAQVLEAHGVDSGRCEHAAAGIISTAREVDPSAVARKCEPLFGRYVCPQRRWFHHVTIYVSDCFVDALTGPDGLENEQYINTHWPDVPAIQWEDVSDAALEALAG